MASKAAPNLWETPTESGDVTGLHGPENNGFSALGRFAPETSVSSRTGGGLSGRVLVLNASFEPINVCSVRRAVVLILKAKAEVIDQSEFELHAEKLSMSRPSVIRLTTYVRIPYQALRRKITRRAVFARDGWQCQYCGRGGTLTMDHVVPRSKGGDSSWENVVACCASCNRRKGDRSVRQSGMTLRTSPAAPHASIFIHVASPSIPHAWRPYVPGLTQVDALASSST